MVPPKRELCLLDGHRLDSHSPPRKIPPEARSAGRRSVVVAGVAVHPGDPAAAVRFAPDQSAQPAHRREDGDQSGYTIDSPHGFPPTSSPASVPRR
jgi:hypothetical protein